MTWLLLTSSTLSLGYIVYNFFGPQGWTVVSEQLFDLGGSVAFLILFWLARRGNLKSRVCWLLSPLYFAFWLALMIVYYFTALDICGENMTFALGAITPAALILLPPRYFMSLLGAYYIAFCGWQADLMMAGSRTGPDLFASIVNGTLAVMVAMLVARFGYRARRATFLNQEQITAQATELRRTSSHLHAILENIPFQAWLKDLDGRYLAVNREFASANSRSQEEIVGRHAADLYDKKRADLYEREDHRLATAAGQRIHEEQVIESSGGRMWYEVFKSPVLDESGNVVGTAGLARDVTDRKRMEELLLAANRTKSEFLAAMSHEIRTPMNSVLGYAQLLQELSLDPVQAEYVDSILSSGRILLVVINDILDFSRIEAGQLALSPVTFRVRPLLERCVRMFEPLASEKGIALDIEVDFGLRPEMHADSARLEQILVNLLSNAVKFTDCGRVTLKAHGDDHTVVFEVADTGIGISPEQIELLFQPFSQVDASISRRYGGTGLGLAITRRLCQLMGGSVDVTSRHNEGSTFMVTLPLGVVRSELPTSNEADKVIDERPDLERLRVLVVEDNSSNRRLMASILRRWHITPLLTGSGSEALELFEKQVFDVVLMDIQMPGMDGLETTRRMRAWEHTQPGRLPVRIIALTAMAMAGDADRCMEAGANVYLPKPINVALLERVLKSKCTPKHSPSSAV